MENVVDVRSPAPGDWQELCARFGLAAKGVSYALVGVLAIGVALGVGGDTTSRNGALRALAGNAFGMVVLGLLAGGFAAYALWRVMQGVADDKWGKRVAHLGRAAVYFGLAYSAARILAGAGGGQSQNAKAHKATALVLGLPGGPWLVGVGGVVIFGVGCWNLYRGISRSFEDKWIRRSGMAERWGGRAGVVGHCARFVVFALMGAFAIRAAADYDPRAAVGLDGALQKLSQQSYGQLLLGVVAAGLVAYAAYCFVDARYRDVRR